MGRSEARVLLIGQGPTAASALAAVRESFSVVALMRSGAPADPVVGAALEAGIDVVEDVSLGGIRKALSQYRPDAVVVSSYSRIIPEDILDEAVFVNVHYAPLPSYRGRATVNWAIINGEESVSISIHSIVPGLDEGPILYRGDVSVGPRSTAAELYAELNDLQRLHLADAVRRRLSGDTGEAQELTGISYACSRNPEDGAIDWSASTDAIDRLIRALSAPFPPAFTVHAERRLAILVAEPVADAPDFVGRVPGRVIAVSRSHGFVDVLTGDGVLRVHKVEVNGTASTAAEEIRSVRDTLGLSLGQLTAWFAAAGRASTGRSPDTSPREAIAQAHRVGATR